MKAVWVAFFLQKRGCLNFVKRWIKSSEACMHFSQSTTTLINQDKLHVMCSALQHKQLHLSTIIGTHAFTICTKSCGSFSLQSEKVRCPAPWRPRKTGPRPAVRAGTCKDTQRNQDTCECINTWIAVDILLKNNKYLYMPTNASILYYL